MSDDDNESKADALIAGLDEWKPGPVTPEEWVGMMGNYELAIGYSFVFWPSFVRFENYVLREGFSVESLRNFEKTTSVNRESVEWVMNHVHIADIHCNEAAPTEAQIRHLGRVLARIHEVKLRSDFPDLSFKVEFNDEPGLDPTDYQFSFWQA